MEFTDIEEMKRKIESHPLATCSVIRLKFQKFVEIDPSFVSAFRSELLEDWKVVSEDGVVHMLECIFQPDFPLISNGDAFKRTKLGYHWHFICEENSFKNRVSLLVAGFDDNGPQLYQVDPSGSYFSWKTSAMGKNVSNAKIFLEKRYTDDMELDDAVHTAILTLKEGVLTPAKIDDYLGEVE
ncbi:proteasome endopeptidase complex [Trifolium repens]|nr:proteasome subunit alpha type-2-A [Trifolium repens]WJX72983.1 proteasome endopeptidase complex [Trifolium repens]